MELDEAIKNRRSIRKYLDKKVERDKILEILEAGIWAPSSGNTQTWRFYVIEKDETKDALSRAALNQSHVRDASAVIVVCFDTEEMRYAYGERGVNLYGIQDTAAAIQNMLLKAHSLGLGTCWVGAFNEGEVKRILNLDAHLKVVALITLGYPAESPISTRKELRDVVVFDEN